MSGCSVATPVAVAIAIMLLEYAAARPQEFEANDLRLMCIRRGVFELFKGRLAVVSTSSIHT